MPVAHACPVNSSFLQGSSTPAVQIVRVAQYVRMPNSQFPTVIFEREALSRRRVHVVPMKPRTFTEIADHFAKVTRPIEWKNDEADID